MPLISAAAKKISVAGAAVTESKLEEQMGSLPDGYVKYIHWISQKLRLACRVSLFPL